MSILDSKRLIKVHFPMMKISNEDTICAIATPPGFGGIGVVRISGPKAARVLAGLWRGTTGHFEFEARKLYLGELASGEGVIDRVMATFMPAPHTYTGQDVVEFSCHGSPIVLRKILDACVSAGARTATPGEFTRRAFLAGKMDLAQAEAVADLIHSTSDKAARRAAEQLSGRLSNEVAAISDELADLRGSIEASIDFPEEDIEIIQKEGIKSRLLAITNRVDALSSTFSEGRLLRDGVKTAIVGRPNVGKSSILNRLVGEERAIVHHVPGTTRDMIEECVDIGGAVFRLRDTAGLRDSNCDVEGMGVARTREEISRADLIVAVFDGSECVADEDQMIAQDMDPAKTIFAINKADLPQRFDTAALDSAGRFDAVFLSAKTGVGADRLCKALFEKSSLDKGGEEGAVVMSARHKEALDEACAFLQKAMESIGRRESAEFIAENLRMAQEVLGKITGEVTTDDLLDRIFSKFCIGK